MDKETKRILGFIAFGVILFVGLTHLDKVISFASYMGNMLLPVLAGMVVAFIMNVPANGLEKRLTKLFKKAKKKPSEKTLSGLSVILSFVGVFVVISVVFTMMIPELFASIKSLYVMVEKRLPEWIAYIETLDISMLGITPETLEAKFADLTQTLANSLLHLADSFASFASAAVSMTTTSLFALIIAIYILLERKDLTRQFDKLVTAYCKPQMGNRIKKVAQLSKETYAKFLTGQCTEAVILGTLIFLAFSLFRLPYAGLIGILTGFFAFIPYIGAFAACVLGAFFTLIANPEQVILCVIVYLVVQFIENQFIYPHVVGNSVGLSALWTVVAALIGGKLLGLIGILFFIPLMAVVYTLVKEHVNGKLKS